MNEGSKRVWIPYTKKGKASGSVQKKSMPMERFHEQSGRNLNRVNGSVGSGSAVQNPLNSN